MIYERFYINFEPQKSYINMDESFMQLTNYSINKHSKDFIQDSEQNGSKRKLETITQYLADKGMDVDKVKSF